MLAFRLIARLDIKAPNLIKTVRLEGVRVVGDPHTFATRYDEDGIDELLYLDAVASLYRRNSLAELVGRATEDVFVPVTVGGGIRSVVAALDLFRSGADKVAVNSAAIARPELITEIAHKFGSQAVVVQIDARRINRRIKAASWEAFCDGGRQPTGKDAVSWAARAVLLGAGEILLTSIDHEGTSRGCDLDLARRVAGAVSVPVVIAGGVGTAHHVVEAAQTGVSGVAMAGVLHYGRVPLSEIRETLRNAGIPVR